MKRKEAKLEASKRWDTADRKGYLRLYHTTVENRYEVGYHKKGKSPVCLGRGVSWADAFSKADTTPPIAETVEDATPEQPASAA